MIYIFQGTRVPDLHDPARVAGWEAHARATGVYSLMKVLHLGQMICMI